MNQEYIILENGHKVTKNSNDEYHSFNDLPAIIEYYGTKEWYQNGKLHRDNDLPAIIMNDGTQKWYQNGKLHRDNNLPAIIESNGNEEYWMNDRKYVLEQKRKTIHNCLIYKVIPEIGTKYKMCSFTEEHIYILEGLKNFNNDNCMYCQNKLIKKTFIQDD